MISNVEFDGPDCVEEAQLQGKETQNFINHTASSVRVRGQVSQPPHTGVTLLYIIRFFFPIQVFIQLYLLTITVYLYLYNKYVNL